MHPYVLRAERRGVSTNRGARPAALLLCGENREAWRAPFARHLMFGWFLVPMSSARALSVFLSTPFSHSHTHVHTRTHIHCPSHCGRDRMARGPSFRKERRGSRTSRGLPRALARQPPLWVWGEGAGRGVDPAWPVGGGSGLGLPRTPPTDPSVPESLGSPGLRRGVAGPPPGQWVDRRGKNRRGSCSLSRPSGGPTEKVDR